MQSKTITERSDCVHASHVISQMGSYPVIGASWTLPEGHPASIAAMHPHMPTACLWLKHLQCNSLSDVSQALYTQCKTHINR